MTTTRGSSNTAIVAILAILILVGIGFAIWGVPFVGDNDTTVIEDNRTTINNEDDGEDGDSDVGVDVDLFPDDEDGDGE